MRIDSYSFGNMVIDGRAYTSDLIIYPDGRIQDSWWREAGHSLCMNDIADLVASKPEIIIAGTGANGLLTPEPELEDLLCQKGIEFRVLPTDQAVTLYNDTCGTRPPALPHGRERAGNTAACFHLTC